MSVDGNHPNPENEASRSSNATNRWQHALAFMRCLWHAVRLFFCWLAESVRKPDNLPSYLIALFTLFFVGFAYYAWDEAPKGTAALQGQLIVLRNEQRAWIAPTGISHDNSVPYVVGNPINYAFLFKNIGKLPAFHLKWIVENGLIATPDRSIFGSNPDFSQRDMCPEIDTDMGSVVFPTGQQQVTYFPETGISFPAMILQSDNLSHGPKIKITQDMLDNLEVFYVRGCISYSTSIPPEKTHPRVSSDMQLSGKSAFCFFMALDRGPDGKRGGTITFTCRNGNSAE